MTRNEEGDCCPKRQYYDHDKHDCFCIEGYRVNERLGWYEIDCQALHGPYMLNSDLNQDTCIGEGVVDE